MKALVKLAALLAVLTICIPAKGEILIYNKTMTGFAAEGDGVTDPSNQSVVNWDWLAGKRVDKGFLILDVEMDENDHITNINEAVQVEYWKNGHEKYYEEIPHSFEIQRIVANGSTYWVLRDIYAPDADQISIIMVEGQVKMSNIGLGSKENQKEVPLKLSGSVLTFLYGQEQYLHYIYEEILTVSLRLNQQWTRLANEYWEIYNPRLDAYDPFEWALGGIDKNGEPYGIVHEWIIQHGYSEAEQGSGFTDGSSQDNDDQDDTDDPNDYGNQSGIIVLPY